ncbi:hypothetical protein [Kribbella sp. VKM Ac-2568]|uniref:hypothetical protein n=1 Tax=Kribbella sp. VKM Ac-2568 TaxID=2512219 RepID=UPI00104F9E85|nr:hypothetical protein [Kribbella sp. VKM Ac-2568]TCM35968.1 hypothetical protein EV648_12316 [Kribbella sp. VKM Ac-2568]
MTKRNRKRTGRPIGKDRRFSIRSELRKEPDIQRIAKAVVGLALAQAQIETDAAAQKEAETTTSGDSPDREAPNA